MCKHQRYLNHRLLNTVDYANAQKILADEESNMVDIAQHGPVAAAAAKSGTAFLAYMKSTWMPKSLWQKWSQKGRAVAATLLKIPIEGSFPPTIWNCSTAFLSASTYLAGNMPGQGFASTF